MIQPHRAGIRSGLLIVIWLAACARPTPSTPTPAAFSAPTASPQPSSTPTVVPSRTPTPAPMLSPTPSFQVCSPLQDISIAELPQIDYNPYATPHPFQDDGHHGADFVYWSRGSHQTMVGLEIYAAIAGKVIAVIKDRPPYGNFTILETPLQSIPPAYLDQLGWQQPSQPVQPDARLLCPAVTADPSWDYSRLSLYILYAHMLNTPPNTVGTEVACGQKIGQVGNTGMSGNPHLHFEVRVGPGGATFDQMSHYNTSATQEEMKNYCLWRASGAFTLVDPMKIFAARP